MTERALRRTSDLAFMVRLLMTAMTVPHVRNRLRPAPGFQQGKVTDWMRLG